MYKFNPVAPRRRCIRNGVSPLEPRIDTDQHGLVSIRVDPCSSVVLFPVVNGISCRERPTCHSAESFRRRFRTPGRAFPTRIEAQPTLPATQTDPPGSCLRARFIQARSVAIYPGVALNPKSSQDWYLRAVVQREDGAYRNGRPIHLKGDCLMAIAPSSRSRTA